MVNNNPKIQTGDIIMYKPRSIIGWVISKITHSPYSHVAIAISPDKIFEANVFINSRIVSIYSDYVGYDKNIHHIYRLSEIDSSQKTNIQIMARQLKDKPYDYKQIFGLFMRLVFNWKTSLFNDLNKFICSEIIDRMYYCSGVKRKDKINLFNITPNELLEKYTLKRVL